MARLTRWLRPQPRTSTRPALLVEHLESRDVPAMFMVNSLADSGAGSLRDAIAQANDELTNPGADTIRFDSGVFGNTINLSTVGDTSFGPSALAITSDITLDGLTGYVSGAGVTIARDAGVNNLRLFVVSAAGSLTLQGVTLSGGTAVGEDGAAGNGGGGGGAGLGGAIFNQGAVSIIQSTLTGNQAIGGTGGTGSGSGVSGGAGGGPNGGTAGTPTGGDAGFGGGGGGGGSSGGFGGDGGFGGAGGGQANFAGGTGNFGRGGFGAGDADGPFAVSGAGGAGLGGAVFNHGGTVAVINSTIAANGAQGGLGGHGGSFSQGLGGGLFNLNGAVTITNSTFSGNAGGALYVLAHDNTDGVGNANAASATLVNSILANSIGGIDLAINQLAGSGGATVTASSPNIIESSTNTGGTYTNSGVISADPRLLTLADNGGPTQTFAYDSCSPAVNAGSNADAAALTNDQRGNARVQHATVDIGAFELLDNTAPTVTSINRVGTSPTNVTSVQFTVTFSECVTGVTAADFALTTTGTLSGVSITNVTGADGTYTVTVGITSGTGTLRLDLIDDDSISDGIPNALGGTGAGNGNFTAGQVYTIDLDAPAVTSVGVPSNGTYIAGQALNFTVNFGEIVTVTGTPRIALTVGSSTVYATYAFGSGTSALVFQYTVQSGDLDADGIAVGVLALNGGTIRDAVANDATLTLNGVGSTAGVLVDAVAPTVISVTPPANGTYVAGQHLDFTVTFNETVTVNTGGGTPYVQLTIGSTTVNASYVLGSGTSALVFRYVVQSGDLDADGITSGASIVLNGGTIRDAATNDATLTLNGVGSTAGVLVDAVAPTVTSVSVPANWSYSEGQILSFIVNFSENVTVTTGGGTPSLSLIIGSTVVNATYSSGSGMSALTFWYTVQAGDTDADGITVGALALNGGTIRDAATNDATLTLNGVGSTAGVLVDTTAPAAPVVTSPATSVTVNAASFAITGTAEADSLVLVYSDLNNNGMIDGADAVVGGQPLIGGATSYNISVILTQDVANNFLVRAIDAAGNHSPLTDVPTITEDSTAATVNTVVAPADGAYRAGQNLDFTLTYSEAVIVTGSPRIALTMGGSIVFASYVSGTGTTSLTFRYTVQAWDTDADGVELGTSIDLNGGSIQDAGLNNASVAVPSTPTPHVIVDTTAPTATITSSAPAATNTSPIAVTVTFSEAITGFDVTRLSVTNGTVGNFLAVNGSTYTFDVIPTSDGVVTVGVVGFASVVDEAGNSATPPVAITRTYDGTKPTVTVGLASGQAAVTSQATAQFSVTFSEDVTGFDASDVIVGGTAGDGTSVSVTGSGANYTVTVTGMTRDGTVNVRVIDAAGTDAIGNTSTASTVSADVRYGTVPTSITTTTPGGSSTSQIRIFNPDTGEVVRTVDPFPGFGGTVDTASADLAGDGVSDVVVGAGFGGSPHVKVIDGATGQELRSFFAFSTEFVGGVDVATGDVTGDGVPDIVVAAGPGGGPHVKVFDGVTGEEIQSFFAYDSGFLSGVNVAVGDVNGDGRADIVTAPMAFGGPHVKVFSGLDNSVLMSFFAYHPTFTGGVNVAVGDTNGDGYADIITGSGLNGAPHVKVFDGQTGGVRASFFAYDPSFVGGVDVAAVDVNGDGYADIVTGAGPGAGPHVKAFDGITFAEIESFYAADADFLGGVTVG